MEFIRFAGTINTHEEKKVAKSTVNVILEDCTGTFYITDIMFQEGKWLTGYVVNNLELLQKNRVDGEITPVRFFNTLFYEYLNIFLLTALSFFCNDGQDESEQDSY